MLGEAGVKGSEGQVLTLVPWNVGTVKAAVFVCKTNQSIRTCDKRYTNRGRVDRQLVGVRRHGENANSVLCVHR